MKLVPILLLFFASAACMASGSESPAKDASPLGEPPIPLEQRCPNGGEHSEPLEGATVLYAGPIETEDIAELQHMLISDAATWDALRARLLWHGAPPQEEVDFESKFIVFVRHDEPQTCGLQVESVSVLTAELNDLIVQVLFLDTSGGCERVCLMFGRAAVVVALPRSASGIPRVCTRVHGACD
jgi:hypothetical protein